MCHPTAMAVAGLCAVLLALPSTASNQEAPPQQANPITDYASLRKFIQRWSNDVNEQPGRWFFRVHDTPVTVLADEQHNRMRVISPVAAAAEIDPDKLRKMLEANFDRTLDARYAIWKGQVWAAYLHPLAELSEKQFHTGVEQVVNLRLNYGTTYSSADIRFGEDGG